MNELIEFIEEESSYFSSIIESYNLSKSLCKKNYKYSFKKFLFTKEEKLIQIFENDTREPLTKNEYLLFSNLFYLDYIYLRIPLYETIFILSFYNSKKDFHKTIKELKRKGYIKKHYKRSYKKYSNRFIVDCRFSYSCYTPIDNRGINIIPERFDNYDI